MCGASSQQKQIGQEQQSAYKELTSQAQSIFGSSSKIFSDLTSAFEPVLAAGPGQEGYTAAEMANLKSQAITSTGEAYRHAAQAAGERSAAAGGGTAVLPSGATLAQESAIAQAGAGQTAQELANIRSQSAQLGRQNWLSAAGVLSGAPSVFGAATQAGEAATQAGGAAGKTAGDIQQANRAWVGDVMGVLGDVSSVAGAFAGK